MLLSWAAPAWAQALPVPDPAVELFVRKCASCHTVGKGDRVGPDLQGVLARRSRPWVEGLIRSPGAMLDTDPEARQLLAQYRGVRMPDLGLTGNDVDSLVELIERCSGQPCDLAGSFVPVTRATVADVARGSDLFVGRRALGAGGAPCFSCHTVRGAGVPVPGGRLATDLTHVFARLGDEGLDAALKAPAFAVMSRVFADHPLAADEVFSLRAFLHEANRSQPVAEDTVDPVVLALLGTGLVLAVLNAAWGRRLSGVRSSLARGRPGEDAS